MNLQYLNKLSNDEWVSLINYLLKEEIEEETKSSIDENKSDFEVDTVKTVIDYSLGKMYVIAYNSKPDRQYFREYFLMDDYSAIQGKVDYSDYLKEFLSLRFQGYTQALYEYRLKMIEEEYIRLNEFSKKKEEKMMKMDKIS